MSEADVTVLAGEHIFRTHRCVLEANSGYFKSFLRVATSTDSQRPVSLPGLPSQAFAVLLHFMYTGRLAITSTNIYEVYLCAQVLHMPTAIDICRRFLLPQQQVQSYYHSWMGEGSHYPSNNNNTAQQTPASIIRPIPVKRFLFPYFPPSIDFTPLRNPLQIPPSSETNPTTTPSEQPTPPSIPPTNDNNNDTNSKPSTPQISFDESGDQTVVDVACCDGPVKFERVINENYKLLWLYENSQQQSQTPKNPEIDVADSTFDTNDPTISKNILLQEENTSDMPVESLCSSADSTTWTDSEADKPSSPIPPDQVSIFRFHCVYCNHPFKSRYCYQKHKRRHINPVTVDPEEQSLRPRDMNVPFYPCKTCGSKFPSYYFVHKHRRQCHPSESSDPQPTTANSS